MSKRIQPFCDLQETRHETNCPRATTIAEEISERFAAFRRAHPKNTRIPSDLRMAVVDALARGLSPSLLRRTCGVSTGQLGWWRTRSRTSAPVAIQPPRVFSVTGDAAPRSPELSVLPPADGLELRLGSWSVCVRQLDSTDVTQG
jgi:hypothetical protein